jgi:hypothetical protein
MKGRKMVPLAMKGTIDKRTFIPRSLPSTDKETNIRNNVMKKVTPPKKRSRNLLSTDKELALDVRKRVTQVATKKQGPPKPKKTRPEAQPLKVPRRDIASDEYPRDEFERDPKTSEKQKTQNCQQEEGINCHQEEGIKCQKTRVLKHDVDASAMYERLGRKLVVRVAAMNASLGISNQCWGEGGCVDQGVECIQGCDCHETKFSEIQINNALKTLGQPPTDLT